MGSTSSKSAAEAPSLRAVRVLCVALTSLLIAACLYLLLPRDSHTAFFASSTASTNYQIYSILRTASLETTDSKYAYVTLLSIDKNRDEGGDINNDFLFVGCRLLAYQILHAPETRSDNIPFIVLAVPGISEAKKQRLTRDGAIVVDIDTVELPSWVPESPVSRWANMFDKLRLWELTQFERVLFLDADMVLTQPLDGVFESATLQLTDPSREINATSSLPPLPPDYIFTAGLELAHEHHFPPTIAAHDFAKDEYVNAGFFVTKPSLLMLDYYLAVLAQPDAFDTGLMEQELLNLVHTPHGNMPFEQLDPIWNMHFPTQEDFDGGVRSLHAKWWHPFHEELLPYLQGWKWRMVGFFEARDAAMLAISDE